MIGQGGSSSSTPGIELEDLQRYLQNPHEHLKQIRNASVYLTNKHGILSDVVRMVKTLPTLKYSLNWVVNDNEDINKYKDIVNDFLEDVDIVDFVRDGLYETALLGTVVPCLRKKKYIQFLEVEEIVIDRHKNGKWVVEYDLKTIDGVRGTNEKLDKIKSLPDEITIGKYNKYKKNKDDKSRYIEIKDCEVISQDALRNSPYGLPYTIGAWSSVLQKEKIDKVERSISDRLLTQILVLSAGHIDEGKDRPVPKEIIAAYFKEVEKMLQQKDNKSRQTKNNSSSSGLIALPHFLNLDSLDIDTTMFKEELYDKITDDIMMNLGVSRALIYGEGGSYSSAQANSEKIFSHVFTLVEQLETAVNNFVKTILPSHVGCKIKFDQSTILDKQKEIDNKKELFLQTSLISPWLESVLDTPISDIVKLREHEEVLKLDELFFPAKNAHTSNSSDDGEVGRPSKDNDEIDSDSTGDSRSNDGNSNPTPADT